MKTISIVSPVYNEEGNIRVFYNSLSSVVKDIKQNYEIIFVNDGSLDGSPIILEEIAREDKHIKVIHFSRNFGHQSAITAGLDFASGDAVVIIDSDMQDPPSIIVDLIKKWENGYDVVNAHRRTRKDSNIKAITAKIFYKVLNFLITNKIPENVGDFRLLDRSVVDVLKKLPEKDRYLRGLSCWVGFKQGIVDFDRDKRYSGTTHYSLNKMFTLAFDAIFSFSKLPIKMALFSSFLFFLVATFVLIYAVISWALGYTVVGWASILFIFSTLSSIQMLVLAIISEYVGRIYTQAQGRPLYVVMDTINF